MSDGLKTQYEERLVQAGDEQETELAQMKGLHTQERDQLAEVIATLKNDIETIKRQIKRIGEERDHFNLLKEKARAKESTLRKVLEGEKRLAIQELEKAKREVQERLKVKEKELYRYKFKIRDLQKTKAVLTHRTQEMKASLEPKEQ
jgi:chromosome segregation ATPase